MVEAIDEALYLYQSHRLSQTINLPPLYSSPVKPKSTADKNNRRTAYSISISGSSSLSVDWTFEIFNCKAFLRDMGKLKTVDVEHAEDKRTLTFKVTQQEMDLFIYRLQSTLENFERMNFSGQYKIAKNKLRFFSYKKKSFPFCHIIKEKQKGENKCIVISLRRQHISSFIITCHLILKTTNRFQVNRLW